MSRPPASYSSFCISCTSSRRLLTSNVDRAWVHSDRKRRRWSGSGQWVALDGDDGRFPLTTRVRYFCPVLSAFVEKGHFVKLPYHVAMSSFRTLTCTPAPCACCANTWAPSFMP